jgi:hypothetical protein
MAYPSAVQKSKQRLAEIERWTSILRPLTGTVVQGGWVVLTPAECYDALELPQHYRSGAGIQLGHVMRSLGWDKVAMRVGGEVTKVWRRRQDYTPPPEPEPVAAKSPFRGTLPADNLPEVISTGTYAGSIEMNGEQIALSSDLGKRFVHRCAQHDEGIRTAANIMTEFDLTQSAWDDLKWDRNLQKAVRALIDQRATSGIAGTEKASAFSGRALDTLDQIHRDQRAPASARAAAAASVIKAAGVGGGGAAKPGLAPSGGPWVSMQIALGGGKTVKLQPPDRVEPAFKFDIDFASQLPADAKRPPIDVTPVDPVPDDGPDEGFTQ